MRKKAIILVVIVLMFLAFVPKAQGFDISLIPSPEHLTPGLTYRLHGISFLFNNGYLLVWHKGGRSEYEFQWRNNHWVEVAYKKNVMPDLTACKVAKKNSSSAYHVFYQQTIRGKITYMQSTKSAENFPARNEVSYTVIMKPQKMEDTLAGSFVIFSVQKDVRRFVRNKVPDKSFSPFFYNTHKYVWGKNISPGVFYFTEVVRV